MKSRISLIVSLCVAVFSSFMLVYFSFEGYYGIGFDLIVTQTIFNVVLFVLLSVVLSSREDCLFFDNNLIKLSRIASRRRSLFCELKKVAAVVFLFTFIESVCVLLFSVIIGKNYSVKNIILMFLFSFFVELFFMILQFYLELRSRYKISFMIISVLFLVMLIAGNALYSYCLEYPDAVLADVFEILNKVNIANYVSYARVIVLWNKIVIPLMIIILLIIIEIVYIVIRIKKLDILSKE